MYPDDTGSRIELHAAQLLDRGDRDGVRDAMEMCWKRAGQAWKYDGEHILDAVEGIMGVMGAQGRLRVGMDAVRIRREGHQLWRWRHRSSCLWRWKRGRLQPALGFYITVYPCLATMIGIPSRMPIDLDTPFYMSNRTLPLDILNASLSYYSLS
jgi:hypothetical protein